MPIDRFLTLIYLAAATAALSLTITRSGVFASIRQGIARQSTRGARLFSCPYCMSHWIAMIIVALYRPVQFVTFTTFAVDMIISVFAIIGFSVIIIGVAVSTVPTLAMKAPPKLAENERPKKMCPIVAGLAVFILIAIIFGLSVR